MARALLAWTTQLKHELRVMLARNQDFLAFGLPPEVFLAGFGSAGAGASSRDFSLSITGLMPNVGSGFGSGFGGSLSVGFL